MRELRSVNRYGWIRDLPDPQAKRLCLAVDSAALPPSVDMRTMFPPVYDQAEEGSCTANALAALCQFDQMKEGHPTFMPSRNFIYYNERLLEGTTGYDSGAQIADGVKALARWGFPPETMWPYLESNMLRRPTSQTYRAAYKERTAQSLLVDQNLHAMKACLAQKQPIIFGFTVYDSFESDAVATSGVVPMPQPRDTIVGGHAVVIVGYTADGHFICRNSWSASWGQGGYFLIPFAYLTDPNLAADFHAVLFVP